MRRTAAALSLGVLVLVTGCGGDDAPDDKGSGAPKPGAQVDMSLLSFVPEKVSIKVGETVTWTNQNGISHVVEQGTYKVDPSSGLRTSETSDGTFSLKVAKKGDVVSHTYPKAGTFTYYCTIHKGMNGTVTVS